MSRSKERLWFKDAFEGIFVRQLGRHLDPSMKAGLKVRGLDLNAPLLPGYSGDVWGECIRYAAGAVYPHMTPAEGTYHIGFHSTDGLASTMLGRTIYAMMKLIGARRAITRMGQNFKSVCNYLEVDVTERDRDCFVARFNEVNGIPYFYKGVVDSMGDLIGAPRHSSELLHYGGHELLLYFDLRGKPEVPFPTRTQYDVDAPRRTATPPHGAAAWAQGVR